MKQDLNKQARAEAGLWARGKRNPLFGTWKGDKKRTYAELVKNLRRGHPKLKEYQAIRFNLYLRYTTKYTYYTYRGEQVRASHRILARSEDSILSEVEPTWINEQ